MTNLPPLPDTPLVSIMLSAYNHERFVVDAIESVLAQDWPADRLEVVVLEDGSSDATLRLLEPYRDRARILTQPNRGIRAVVNRLMEEMHGDVIVAAAGDDISPPDRVRLLVDGLRAHPSAGLVYSDQEVIDEHGATVAPSFMAQYGLPHPSGRIRGQLLRRNVVSGGACALRGALKQVFHPIPEAAPWEDYWWAWAVSGVADVAYLPRVTYRYRRHGANVAHGATGERLIAAQRLELGFRRFMLERVRPSQATALEVLDGIAALEGLIGQIAMGAGTAPADVLAPGGLDVGAADRHLRTALDAASEGDLVGAAFACARAAAAAPLHAPAEPVLAAVHRGLVAGPPPTLHTRGTVVLADAGELLASPALLDAYGQRFGPDDDVTLVIHGPAREPAALLGDLQALLARVGIDDEASADMVIVTDVAGGRAALVRRSDARLGEAAGLAALPSALTCPTSALAVDYLG